MLGSSKSHATCPTCGQQPTSEHDAIIHKFTVNPELLHTNYIPSTDETQDIRDSIKNAKSLISSMETQIQQARNALARLERQQQNVKNYVTSQEGLLSPIRHIPPEMLGQIFLALRDISDPICFGDEVLENVEIWSLLRVCRLWRDVALSYTELWSQFNIVRQPFSRPDDSDGPLMLKAMMQFTKDCLTFSRHRPLSFVFHANKEFLNAGELLARESERWSSAAFNNRPLLEALEPKIRDRLPNLTSLDLDAMGSEWTSETQPLNTFSNASSLKCLLLDSFSRPQSRFIIPWHQITHFTSIDLRDYIPVLRCMPSLADYTSVDDICQPHEIQERILLPNLERLEVTSSSPTTSQIFDALKTPKLKTLVLTAKRGFSRIYAEAVVQMVRWSDCSPRDIYVAEYAADSILRMAKEMRDLEVMEIATIKYPSELLAGLGELLPKLNVLILRRCECDIQLGQYLVDMIQARIRTRRNYGNGNPNGQSLVKLSIRLWSSPMSKFFNAWKPAARQLEELGVKVELLY